MSYHDKCNSSPDEYDIKEKIISFPPEPDTPASEEQETIIKDKLRELYAIKESYVLGLEKENTSLKLALTALREKYRWRKTSEELPEVGVKVMVLDGHDDADIARVCTVSDGWFNGDRYSALGYFPLWRYVDKPGELHES